MSQKLRKIMVDHVITVGPDDTIKRAAELMNLHEMGCLIVVSYDKPVGIITERDVLNRVVNESRDAKKTRISEVMSKPLVTASPNMRSGDAAKLMLERNIKKLPVVEEGKLVGLVSLTDLLRSEGVIEFLNKQTLNGASKRLRQAVSIFYDPLKQHRRKCPLIMKDGFSIGCQLGKCMWWVGDECAVTKLTKQMSSEPLEEPKAMQQLIEEN
jgi:CBS domain-containing protein